MNITPRTAITLTFIAFGMMMGGEIGAIPGLKDQAGLDAFAFGALSTVAAVADIIGLSLGGTLNRYFDHRSVLLFILPLELLTFGLTLGAHSLWSCAITWSLFGLCIGINDLFMNAEASVVEHTLEKPVFSSFHAAVLYAIGASGFLSAWIAARLGVIYCLVPSLPLVALAMYAVHVAIPHRPAIAEDSDRATAKLPLKILTLIGALLGLCVASELACMQWSGQLLEATRPDLAAWSGLGVGFYGLFSGTVRAVGDALRARFGDIQLVVASFVISLCGFATLSFHPGFSISIVAFALTGCGLGLIFPCLFSLAAALVPHARASALGFASMVSGPPRIFSPLLLGWLAQAYGLFTIYIAAVGLSVIALVLLRWMARAMPASAEAFS